MNYKKLVLSAALFVCMTGLVNAQVGIGNATPNAGSILDLTNSNDKALLLPTSTILPTSVGTFSTAGMLFYYQDKLFLRTSTGTNVLSPWIFSGTAANGVYSPSGTPIGIGIAPIVSSTAILTVADAAAEVTVSTSTASVVIGDNDFNATHMLIDKDELLVKTNATTAGTLKLQEDGGTVEVRGAADAGTTTVLTAYGSVDAKGKVKENGNDLLPVGAIIMWNGTTVPAGWALCDGGTYTLDAGGTTVTPNLMDKFIVGADATNGTGGAVGAYSYSNTGGVNTVTLTVAQMPVHNHAGTTNTDGAHNHTGHETARADNDDNDQPHNYLVEGSPNYYQSFMDIASTGSSHSHNFTTNNNGGGGAHENRPPYYALAYIMKL